MLSVFFRKNWSICLCTFYSLSHTVLPFWPSGLIHFLPALPYPKEDERLGVVRNSKGDLFEVV